MTDHAAERGKRVPNLPANANGNRPPPEEITLPQRQFQSIVSADLDGSSDDDILGTGRLPEEDARSLINVSISQEQSRLSSPQTPAAERNAVLDPQDGGPSFDERPKSTGEEKRLSSSPRAPTRKVAGEARDFPSPWRSGPKAFTRTASNLSTLVEDGRVQTRTDAKEETSPKRFLSFALPSLPKAAALSNFTLPSLQLPFMNSRNDHDNLNHATNRSKRSSTLLPKPVAHWNALSSKEPVRSRAKTISPTLPQQHTLHGQAASRKSPSQKAKDDSIPLDERERARGGASGNSKPSLINHEGGKPPQCSMEGHWNGSRPLPLRRSTSDSSLMVNRSLSRVSSLGDDTRFDSVQEQINSRLKAIRDSFADSNFKLPSIPNMNLVPSRFSDSNVLNSQIIDSKRARSNTVSGEQKNDARPGSSSSARKEGSQSQSGLVDVITTADANSGSSSHLLNAMSQLTGDLVIMGGYRGSVLRSAKAPHRQFWIPVKVGLNLRKVNLEVGLDPKDEETMEERIISSGMLTHIGPVDISRRLLKRLRTCENAVKGKLRIWDYGYDWRLSPHLLSRKLIKFLEGLASNDPDLPSESRGALVIGHSLGGIITRHAVNERPELFSGVVYAGVPQTCVNILGPLRNGDEVLLSSRVLTAQVNFTLRTSFVFLPEDGKCFVDSESKEQYPVDFFDVNTWIEHKLSPCVATLNPPSTPNSGGLGGLVESVSGSLPSLPLALKKSSVEPNNDKSSSPERINGKDRLTTKAANFVRDAGTGRDHTIAPQLNGESNAVPTGHSVNGSLSTGVTISRDDAIAYLQRTLTNTLRFKKELHFQSGHAVKNEYPPIAVLYGKSLPTVYGAKVNGREGIKHAEAYENLAFASGDGVCLARAAMVPEGYEVARGGRVSSDRGHVTLLGDLEGVGRCLEAVIASRRRGTGLGLRSGQK
ncbi:MAG: hypothetical protein M1837_004424 [Sclerophora amabilis]|nr:MAG: hypothetical protein M1837_004424 [Sclerophora amabilis]